MSIKAFLISSFMVLSFSLKAQEPISLNFRHLTLEDGISQSTVSDIFQDEKGFIWMATLEGINRFDGNNFTIFKNEIGDSNSITNSFVDDLQGDGEGNLWGTTNNGLSKINLRTEQITQYFHDPEDPHSITHNSTVAMLLDGNGDLWITSIHGVSRYIPDKDHFQRYYSPEGSSNGFTEILEDHKGTIWLGSGEEGLFIFDREKEEVVPFHNFKDTSESLSKSTVFKIFEDSRHNIWVGTSKGLKKINPGRDKIQTFYSAPNDPHSLSNNIVNDIYEDSYGHFWVGTNDGLNLYNRENQNFYVYKSDPGDPNSMIGDRISVIYEDDQNILWIGNWTGGINMFDYNNKGFKHYKKEPSGSKGLSNNTVWDFSEVDGTVWLGTDGGLNSFSPATKSFETYLADDTDPRSLLSNIIIDITKDEQNNLWMATSEGLNKFNPQSKKFTSYTNNPDDPESLVAGNLISVYSDPEKDVIWIGSGGSGMSRMDLSKRTIKNFVSDPNDPSSISSNSVSAIFRDSKGVLWIGTYNGLNKMNEEEGTFQSYVEDRTDSSSISNSLVTYIFEDSKKRLWVSTLNGLNLYDRETETFTYFTENEGLPNNTIYAMEEDGDGNLYVSTNFGLSRFNPEEYTFSNYDIRDGLQDNEFNIGSVLRSSTGELYFGGINGFNVFKPDSIKKNPHKPPVVLTKFELYNHQVPVGEYEGREYLKKTITYTDTLILPHTADVFSFEFAALDYAIPEKNQFAYKMENFEENWNYVGHRNYVTYTNLPPGEFIFRVKAANNDGVWNEVGTSLIVVITPPFWQTTWFYVIVVICLTAVIFTGYRFRVRSITEHNRHLEQVVKERTSELDEKNSQLADKNEHLEELLQELKDTRNELVEKAHKAGMADIATGVLHNVGNILNSVNTSASIMESTLKKSKLQGLVKANKMLRENLDRIDKFIAEDSRGEKLLNYYLKLEDPLLREKQQLIDQNARLTEKIQLINDVISTQQSYATAGMFMDSIDLTEMIESALTLLAGSIDRHHITVKRDIDDVSEVIGQSTKIVHILLNLFKNAKEAMDSVESNREHVVDISLKQDDSDVYLSIVDNGCGISDENLKKIFTHGFTTKTSGHGFGLHSCSNYMTEMGGELTVDSPGIDKGATFTLIFPRADKVDQTEEGKVNGKPKI
ncbi:MAG: GHKL domain-containing protein [Balneolaceae bacterium]|nr:GHKL domain-containing protein [Balneolaceae bacterium]